ncbi:MAG: DUF262 domain-containing protein [Candidatus Methanoperedens sp.]
MSISKSQTEKIGPIFNGNRFIIPSYQRKYSWTGNERNALWQDIKESLNSNMNHFVGTLTFKENKPVGLLTDTLYEIIDGQQRVTTLFILLSVLIDKLPEGGIKTNQRNVFIGTFDNLKLRPQGEDEEFLKQLIFDFSNIDFSKINKRSQKFMYAAKQDFAALVNPLSMQQVEKTIIFIRDSIEVLVFNVENQAQAVKMFSIINDRGLSLNILDKTKSFLMLYSTLHLKEKLNNLINNSFEKIFDSYDDLLVWKDKLGILGRLEENTIFTHHYYSSKRLFPETWNSRDGADTVFKNLKLKCEQLKDNATELENFITDYLIDFTDFAVKYTNLVKEVETKSIYQKPFQFLDFTATLYPLLVRLYMKGKLDALLNLLEATEVRVYKLKGTNPSADMYRLSSDVTKENMSIDDIRQRLITFNEEFMNNHNMKNNLELDVYQNGAVKYILSEYNNDNPNIDSYKDWQVEHIFSKDPDFEPSSYGFGDDYNYEKNRLGNLGLLEGGINKGISNSAPINKVAGYLKSSVSDTRNLAGEIQLGNFTKNNVDSRREKIIDFCLTRFKVN